MGLFVGVQEVNFYNNSLIRVPPKFTNLVNLEDLNLGGNKLKTICSTKSWVALERLAISWNMIVLLNDFGGMPNLKVLQVRWS